MRKKCVNLPPTQYFLYNPFFCCCCFFCHFWIVTEIKHADIREYIFLQTILFSTIETLASSIRQFIVFMLTKLNWIIFCKFS